MRSARPTPTLNTINEMMSPINMIVPAAESQLVEYTASYGVGFGTTGAVCATCPSSPGQGTTGNPVVSLTTALGKFIAVCVALTASLIGPIWTIRNSATMMRKGDHA